MVRKVKFRSAIPIVMTLIFTVSAVMILVTNYTVALSSISKLSQERISNVAELVLEKTLRYLAPALNLADMDAVLLHPKNNPYDFATNFVQVTSKQLSIYPQLSQAYFGDMSGNFLANTREKDESKESEIDTRIPDKHSAKALVRNASKLSKISANEQSIAIKLDNSIIRAEYSIRNHQRSGPKENQVLDYAYDPRSRPWFRAAKENLGTVWTPAYVFSSSDQHHGSNQFSITASSPIFENKYHREIYGVVGIDITLMELSKFIEHLKIGKTGRAFIVNSSGQVIALKNHDEIVALNEAGQPALATVNHISDLAIRDSFNHLSNISSRKNRVLDFKANRFARFESGSANYFAYYLPFPKNIGLNWYIGIVVPEKDYVSEIYESLFYSIAIALISISLVYFFSRWVAAKMTAPVQLLTDQAFEIQNFNFHETPKIQSFFFETDSLLEAFIQMKLKLSIFKKYTPVELVRNLDTTCEISNHEGRRQCISAYSSNIDNFLKIAEQMNPEDLLPHLSVFTSLQAESIQIRGGTADTSDGVITNGFWNAPIPVLDHALKACEAALEVKKKLNHQHTRWNLFGLPELKERIGIDTGNAIVGNIGSNERLHYTAIGGPVSSAARLESLCKYFRVRILLGENAFREASFGIEARLIDRVSTPGRENMFVYELLCLKGKLTNEARAFRKVYEDGLQAYFSRKWVEAETHFTHALKMDSLDHPSTLMLDRCRLFSINPPTENWDGVFKPFESIGG